MEHTSCLRFMQRRRILCVFVLGLFLLFVKIILMWHRSEPLTFPGQNSECSTDVFSKCTLRTETVKSSKPGNSNLSASGKSLLTQDISSDSSRISGTSPEYAKLKKTGRIQGSQQLPLSRIVHQIVWNNSLSFKNYLSILSVVKHLEPYVLLLHTRKSFKLRPSEFDYNDWGEKVMARIPYVQIQTLDLLEKKEYSQESEIECALSVLRKFGGIYLNINTLVTKGLWDYENKRLRPSINITTPLGFLTIVETSYHTEKFWWEGSSSCVPCAHFAGSEICCIISKDIVPADIISADSAFGSLARTLFYGKPSIPEPDTSFTAIPKIVHYVWFGDKDINYSMFLSFLSTQRFVKPTKIYIYVNTKKRTSSVNFDKMVAYSNVEVVLYGPLESIYQKHIASPSHASDIVRADVLLRYGGIYIDWDVYWMKPVDELLSRGYETIAALDFMKDMYPRQGFPDTINMGVVMARPGSRFICLWRESFRCYSGRHATYHAVENVYKIYEEHPDLLFLDSRLQIMCFEFKCHPLWLDNYKDASVDNKFDFREDVYSIHFTHPRPDSFKSEEAVRTSKGFFGDMARHISGIE